MHHRHVVVTPAVHVEVLVLAEAPEVEGLAVDEELRAVDAHGADADGQRVAVDQGVVVEQVDLQLVEVPSARAPELRLRHTELAAAARRVRHLPPVGVAQRHLHRGGAGPCHDGPPDHAHFAFEVGDHGDVVDVGPRRRVQPDAPVQPRVIEEVVVLALPADTGGHHLVRSPGGGTAM